MSFKYKIIIADVDDTICPSTKRVNYLMLSELNRLVNLGYKLVFISGSTVKQIYDQLSGIGGEYHLLGTSGTTYSVVKNNIVSEVYSHVLSEEERQRIIGALNHIVAKYSLPRVNDQIQDRGTQVTLSAIGRNASHDAKKAFDPNGSKRKAWVKEIEEIIGNTYNIKIGGSTSIDITKYGMDKGWGVNTICDYYGWNKEDCIFYGDKLVDGGNDFPVIGVVDTIMVTSWEDTLEHFRHIPNVSIK